MNQKQFLLPFLLLLPLLACSLFSPAGYEADRTAVLGTEVALQQTQVALQQTQVALNQGSNPSQPSNPAGEQPAVVATQPPAPTNTPVPAVVQPTQPPAPAPTNPPPPPAPAGLTAEDQTRILEFTRAAAAAFIDAYWYSDPSYANSYYAGVSLQNIQTEIANLTGQGIYAYYEYDSANSYMINLKLTTEGMYIADVCESWNVTSYYLANDEFVDTLGWGMYPQTFYIQNIGGQLKIVEVVYQSDVSVCAP